MARQFDVGEIGIVQEDLPPFDQGPIDVRAWFGSGRVGCPLDLEIGCGKGTFLVQEAPQSHDVNFLAIEWAKEYWRYAADRCRRRGIENVRLVRAEAAMFVRCYLADALLRQVHVYFPDPWPKKKHHKRRLIQGDFLRQLHRVLVPGGAVRLATDHAGYFAWMQNQLDEVGDIFQQRVFASTGSAEAGEWVGTNFERKYRREGRAFHGIVLAKQ